jgi:DNA helicase II / ATP-dependent DNA helicase PcrA
VTAAGVPAKNSLAHVPELFAKLNDDQREAAQHVEGPLLIIAGPGSGKTTTLVARTAGILIAGLAQPREVVLCTYTEKAAGELRDRLSESMRNAKSTLDLSELLVGTIHGVCNGFIQEFRHHTELGSNYRVLDELTQALFVYENFAEVIGEPDANSQYLGKYVNRWGAIRYATEYFNEITEELVDPTQLAADPSVFVRAVGEAYIRYEAALSAASCLDFSHQQKEFFRLLDDPEVGPKVYGRVKYVMVDEYQDTNYVQEQIILRLAGERQNVCVVGDDDQALYRFRGATVRNILEFPNRFPDCRRIRLGINYRSHERIIAGYSRFMAGADWSSRDGRNNFRFAKDIRPDPAGEFPEYPAVCCIWGTDERDEAARFADLAVNLKDNQVVEDYSQIALLLHSVRIESSGRYIEALRRLGIPAYCPRARAYFDNPEVRDLVASFAVLLRWHGDNRGELAGRSLAELGDYVNDCLRRLSRHDGIEALTRELSASEEAVWNLREGESLDWRLADFLYRVLANPPFPEYLEDENSARNIARFSQLVTTFQGYYHQSVFFASNRVAMRFQFFNSFLRYLKEKGQDEWEDPDQPFPRGYVQIMTIHQSKGLEFPVVVVDSLARQLGSQKQIDKDLGPYYHRQPFEPESRITEFDRMRLFYVAFSRAEKLLVLSSTQRPLKHFDPIWNNLDQWPYAKMDLLKGKAFELRNRMPDKKSFSFTMDLRAYETCPRQYQMFRHFEFSPARSAEMFFGSLVHGTIEEIHRWVLNGDSVRLIRKSIPGLFDDTFRNLVAMGMRPIDPVQREIAYQQVINYFDQNQEEMKRVVQAEVDVSLEEKEYILTGKVDLLMGHDQKLELLDFKAQRKPTPGDPRVDGYYRQLCIYAHILERRHGKRPDRLLLYWTGEKRKQDALMTFPYDPAEIEGAADHFHAVVSKILDKDFTLIQPPEAHVCHDCDFRNYCIARGSIPSTVLAAG